jgi:hypothetical protein
MFRVCRRQRVERSTDCVLRKRRVTWWCWLNSALLAQTLLGIKLMLQYRKCRSNFAVESLDRVGSCARCRLVDHWQLHTRRALHPAPCPASVEDALDIIVSMMTCAQPQRNLSLLSAPGLTLSGCLDSTVLESHIIQRIEFGHLMRLDDSSRG